MRNACLLLQACQALATRSQPDEIYSSPKLSLGFGAAIRVDKNSVAMSWPHAGRGWPPPVIQKSRPGSTIIIFLPRRQTSAIRFQPRSAKTNASPWSCFTKPISRRSPLRQFSGQATIVFWMTGRSSLSSTLKVSASATRTGRSARRAIHAVAGGRKASHDYPARRH